MLDEILQSNQILERYEGKAVIQEKEHVAMYVTTGTTNLGLTSDIHKT